MVEQPEGSPPSDSALSPDELEQLEEILGRRAATIEELREEGADPRSAIDRFEAFAEIGEQIEPYNELWGRVHAAAAGYYSSSGLRSESYQSALKHLHPEGVVAIFHYLETEHGDEQAMVALEEAIEAEQDPKRRQALSAAVRNQTEMWLGDIGQAGRSRRQLSHEAMTLHSTRYRSRWPRR